ncbi:MAG: hypothetical protein PHU25_21915, partial [Deltaproteobacteria bacterium]|nr:hypothetical protein [Deltaproteobacteria bacterium]
IVFSSTTGWSEPATCAWHCDQDVVLENGTCIGRKLVPCRDVAPANATSNVVLVEITYSDADGWSLPATCEWACNTDFVWESDACIHEKQVPCRDVTPANATSTITSVTVTYTTAGGWSEPAECQWACNAGYVPENGACIPDPCIGVVCNQPPSPTCEGDARVTYDAIGACNRGQCSYASHAAACEHGCANGSCKACSVGECCDNGAITPAGTVCGQPASQEYACDSQECGGNVKRRDLARLCDGVSPVCGTGSVRWSPWMVVESCHSYSHCTTDGSTAWCESCEFGCAQGACNINLPPDPATVATPLDPTVVTRLKEATEFLYTGDDPIQKGLDPGIIEEKRVAVLRGVAQNKDNSPLPGVTITVLNHPEYGSTVTREDGQFDLVANGGGQFVVRYEKEGFLPVQRRIDTPWEDYRNMPPVVMVPVDPALTPIDLADTSEDFHVAMGSTTSDARGERQGVLLIPAGTQATMVMSDGSRHPIDQLDLRITEYTVGTNGEQTMPAELPPTTMYNYCFEVSADQAIVANAKTVELDRTAYYYVENYWQAPVGGIVPVGYYDRDKAAWIPDENGSVMEILDVVDGAAVIDVEGKGVAATSQVLGWFGVTPAELEQMALLFDVGETFWRMPINHFTPVDGNEAFWIKDGAAPPNPPEPSDESDPAGCETTGSSIRCADQSMGEHVAIPGAGFDLVYRSDRVWGRRDKWRANIPLQSPDYCTSSSRSSYTDAEFEVGGRVFRYARCCETGECAGKAEICEGPRTVAQICGPSGFELPFEWDGLDAYGRRVNSTATLWARLGNTYVSCPPSGDGSAETGMSAPMISIGAKPAGNWAFGGYCGPGVCSQQTGVYGDRLVPRSCMEVTLWRTRTYQIGMFDSKTYGLGGWSLGIHHTYNPMSSTLYLGTGEVRKATSKAPIILPVSTPGSMYIPSLVVSPEGTLWYVGGNPPPGFMYGLWKVSSSGTATPANPTYTPADLAVWEKCGGTQNLGGIYMTQLEFGPDGDLYIAAGSLNRSAVFKVDKNNGLHLVAGCGNPADGIGNGPDAKQAWLHYLTDLAIDSQGNIFLAEGDGAMRNRIRRVDASGGISTLPDIPNNPADHSIAINFTYLAIGPNDELYTLNTNYQTGSRYLWKLTTDGAWTNIAGTKECTDPCDPYAINTPIFKSRLAITSDLAVDRDGAIFIGEGDSSHGDYEHSRLRIIVDDMVRPFAGTGVTAEDARDHYGPALKARIYDPRDVAIAPDGSVYFSDLRFPATIHKVAQPSGQDGGASTYLVPSEDGSEVYVFDRKGRHLKTRDAMTGAVRYEFAYDANGLLSTVTDGSGNVTTIDRDSDGRLRGIVPPNRSGGPAPGLRTNVELDANEYISGISTPDGASYRFESTTGGLMTRFVDPRQNPTVFTYDGDGRLTSDKDALDSVKTLARTEHSRTNVDVEVTSGAGYETTYNLTLDKADKSRKAKVTFPSGVVNTMTRASNDDDSFTYADGTTIGFTPKPDVRWGTAAPVPNTTVQTPNGLKRVATTAQTVTYQNPNLVPQDVMSMTKLDETSTVNNKAYRRVFDKGTSRWTFTSPMNRLSTMQVDAKGRPTAVWRDGLEHTSLTYDAYGKITRLEQGSGASTRTYDLGYDTRGFLLSVTDPLGRMTTYVRDNAGRIGDKILPDNREIRIDYDASGNVIGVKPPERPWHEFDYTAVNTLENYLAPDVGEPYTTTYEYDLDRNVRLITRPDGRTIELLPDAAGRVGRMQTSDGVHADYAYDSTTGKLATISGPYFEELSYTYSGFLVIGESLDGVVAGDVTHTYNNDFRVATQSVNGAQAVSFGYDNDGLLTGAGALTLTRDASNGLMTSATVGTTSTSFGYNTFGELGSMSQTAAGQPVYSVSYTRDAMGRIDSQTESVQGVSKTYGYFYDQTGRLTDVTEDGTLAAHYEYDDNGNRLSRTDSRSGTAVETAGTYDAQDRMTSYGDATYAYSYNGELVSKTVG